MNFFSKIFGRAANALTVFNPANQGNDTSWQGFEITNSVSYALSV